MFYFCKKELFPYLTNKIYYILQNIKTNIIYIIFSNKTKTKLCKNDFIFVKCNI